MARKARNPGAGRRQGFGLELVSQAGSDAEANALAADLQDRIAVRRLVARFGVTASTALAIAEANAWGGVHA